MNRKTLAMLRQRVSELCKIAGEESSDLPGVCSDLFCGTSGALALSIACASGEVDREHLEAIADLANSHENSQVRELFERFLPEHQRVKRLGPSIDAAALLAMKGDADKGEQLFWETSDVTCRNCHRIGDRGVMVGPDLTDIGLRQKPAEILNSLLDPSAKVDPKFQTHSVLTEDGTVVNGVIVEETSDSIHLVDASGKRHQVSVDDITTRRPSDKSVMPDRLLAGFTAQQAADLMSYLFGPVSADQSTPRESSSGRYGGPRPSGRRTDS